MALNFQAVKQFIPSKGTGGTRKRVYDVTFDNAYPVGGYPITPANFGLQSKVYIVMGQVPGFQLNFDRANQKIMFFKQSAATGALIQAAANEAGLNGLIGTLLVEGY